MGDTAKSQFFFVLLSFSSLNPSISRTVRGTDLNLCTQIESDDVTCSHCKRDILLQISMVAIKLCPSTTSFSPCFHFFTCYKNDVKDMQRKLNHSMKLGCRRKAAVYPQSCIAHPERD